jgi:3D (Asp-Asp-Asp) domain-containing protein
MRVQSRERRLDSPIERAWARPLLTLGCVLLLTHTSAAARSGTMVRRAPADDTTTFIATAYCHAGMTATGVGVHEGVVAADPTVLPLGTVVRLKGAGRYDGPYTVLDTGAKVQRRRVDVFIRDCAEAIRFGRRNVRVTIVRSRS